MANVGIFVGSSSGVTLEAGEKLEELFEGSELINMEEDFDDLEQFNDFDVLLIGSSTWGQGDPQRDWVDPLYEMENDMPDLSGKKVAFFGAGDQDTHGEHFVSALSKLKKVFQSCNALTSYGYTSVDGYDFEFSLAQEGDQFCGLAIDNINQEDLSEERIEAWAKQIKEEMEI